MPRTSKSCTQMVVHTSLEATSTTSIAVGNCRDHDASHGSSNELYAVSEDDHDVADTEEDGDVDNGCADHGDT